MGFLDFVPIIGKVLDRIIPDPAAKAAASLELFKLQQAGEFKEMDAELQLMLAQADINKVEAASPSLWKSGWRPFIGWVCGSGFAYMLVVRPILPWLVVTLGGRAVDMPAVDLGVLTTTLGALLGVGTMRTIEKKAGVA
jgi:hypothetical protein